MLVTFIMSMVGITLFCCVETLWLSIETDMVLEGIGKKRVSEGKTQLMGDIPLPISPLPPLHPTPPSCFCILKPLKSKSINLCRSFAKKSP